MKSLDDIFNNPSQYNMKSREELDEIFNKRCQDLSSILIKENYRGTRKVDWDIYSSPSQFTEKDVDIWMTQNFNGELIMNWRFKFNKEFDSEPLSICP